MAKTQKRVFEGVKVVDFGWVLAGPIILKSLADYGATVICVETNKRPELLRTSAPYKDGVAGVNRSGYYAFYAPNKYSISLDLTQADGVEIARKLVSWADIVADNHRPGWIEKIGLGYDDLRKIKPDIIMIQSSNQGLTGPHASYPGLGNHINGLSGLVNFIGWPDQVPVSLIIAYTDYLAPLFSVSALVAALDYRRRTGKGQLLDVSQFEVALQLVMPSILNYLVNGIEDSRMGNSCSHAAPHGVYRCKGEDRWCAIAAFNDAEWEDFCRVIGDPSWTRDPKFATLKGRKEHEEELNGLIEAWTTDHAAEEVMSLMQEAGVAAGVVQNAQDLYQDPQMHERRYFWQMEHRELGKFTHLGQPSILSKTPAEPQRHAPCLGEHTEYVCKELLGLPESEFDRLLVDGVLSL